MGSWVGLLPPSASSFLSHVLPVDIRWEESSSELSQLSTRESLSKSARRGFLAEAAKQVQEHAVPVLWAWEQTERASSCISTRLSRKRPQLLQECREGRGGKAGQALAWLPPSAGGFRCALRRQGTKRLGESRPGWLNRSTRRRACCRCRAPQLCFHEAAC